MNSTTELTTEMVYNDVKGFLSEAGEVLTEGATLGFELMVTKIFWVDGASKLALGICVLLFALWMYSKLCTSYKSFNDGDVERIPLIMFGGTVIVILILVGVGGIYNAIPRMIIPEYYAIEQIIGFVK